MTLPEAPAPGEAWSWITDQAREIGVLWWRVLRLAYLRFCFSGANFMAASLAFYSLLCMCPLAILLVAGLQSFGGLGASGYSWLERALQDLGVEAATAIVGQVTTLLQNPQPQVANLISLGALLWAGMKLFETMERALTEIWPGRVVRHYVARKLVALVAMTVAGVLLGSVVIFNATLAAARPWLQRIPVLEAAPLELLRPRFTLMFGFLTSALAFSLLYKLVPVQFVRTRSAAAGGLLAALMWFAASPIFTHLITRSNRYSIVYGGLGSVVIFSLWALLGAQVLLGGAHFTAMFEHVFMQRRPASEDDALVQAPMPLREWLRRKALGAVTDLPESDAEPRP